MSIDEETQRRARAKVGELLAAYDHDGADMASWERVMKLCSSDEDKLALTDFLITFVGIFFHDKMCAEEVARIKRLEDLVGGSLDDVDDPLPDALKVNLGVLAEALHEE